MHWRRKWQPTSVFLPGESQGRGSLVGCHLWGHMIKIARVGTRKEGQPDNDPNDFRLVFEIEFVKKLFKDYRPVELEIWHTFTDTTMKAVLER